MESKQWCVRFDSSGPLALLGNKRVDVAWDRVKTGRPVQFLTKTVIYNRNLYIEREYNQDTREKGMLLQTAIGPSRPVFARSPKGQFSWLLVLLMGFMPVSASAVKETKLWGPVTWTFRNPSYAGNRFDPRESGGHLHPHIQRPENPDGAFLRRLPPRKTSSSLSLLDLGEIAACG
jgi:hypothetical protein